MPVHSEQLLVHPLRHRLVLEYSRAPACPADVARRLDEPLNLVAYHTGVLCRNGFIELQRTEQRRGAVTRFYAARVGTVIDDAGWAGLPPRLRRALVIGTLELALRDTRHAARAGGFDQAFAHLSRSPVELDATGREQLTACLDQALSEIAAISARAQARTDPKFEFEAVLLAFTAAPSAAPTD